jgi:ElaB/YqjD/DUF883 family membrane-anchored ribosome-binding protein
MGDLGMKKFLLGLVIMFISIASVNAASSGSEPIVLEDIEIKNYEVASFEEVLEVEYKLIPSDVENKTITWSISGLVKGVTATFVDGNKTNEASGKISIEFKNTTEESKTVKLTAKSGSVTKTVEVKIEVEEDTDNRELLEAKEEVESLINDLPESIDSSNYDSTVALIEDIESILDSKEEVKDLLDAELLNKYDEVVAEVNSYVEENNFGTIVIIVILALSFLLGLFMIFKKEGK